MSGILKVDTVQRIKVTRNHIWWNWIRIKNKCTRLKAEWCETYLTQVSLHFYKCPLQPSKFLHYVSFFKFYFQMGYIEVLWSMWMLSNYLPWQHKWILVEWVIHYRVKRKKIRILNILLYFKTGIMIVAQGEMSDEWNMRIHLG